MDLFQFIVNSFDISDTRADHNDTLHLMYSAYVDGDVVASKLLSLGDFNNGHYVPDDQDQVPDNQKGGLNRVVINDPNSRVIFLFQLVNANNPPPGALDTRLAATSDQLAGIIAGIGGAGAFTAAAAASPAVFWIGVALEVFANLYSWLNVDCDGPVAVDQVSGPRYVVDFLTEIPGQPLIINRQYPGSDSPTGCGGNSNYRVTWTLSHSLDWVLVAESDQKQFKSKTAISAVVHNGVLYAFGVSPNTNSPYFATTFTGAEWIVSAEDTAIRFCWPKQPASQRNQLR